MRYLLCQLVPVLLAGSCMAQPLRSADDWAIYPQADAPDWEAVTTGSNVAEGTPVTCQPAPNYEPTSDADDLAQLTDGVLAGAAGRMWTDRRAVGWAYHEYVRIVIDLGEPQPVSSVVGRFQIIGEGNTLPRRTALSLSQDGEYFVPVRSLIEQVHADDNPGHSFEPLPTDTPGIYAIELQAGYRARYVRLDFTTRGILVCDEIAVMAATDAVQELPPAPVVEPKYFDNVFDRRDQYSKLIEPGNLVAGMTLRYAPSPNYRLTTDDADPDQLTDGELGERVDERIWFEKGAVCWQGPPLVTIFADLGEVQPIASAVIRLLGGGEQGSLNFPDEVSVLLSDDGEDYYLVSARHRRGLDDLSPEAWDLPEEKLAWVHNFALPVGVKARYLAVQLSHQKQFFCTDEVAVVKGADDLPLFSPSPEKRVVLVTDGVAFSSHHPRHPIATQPLRTKIAALDARSGAGYGEAATLVLDLPETVRFVTEKHAESEEVTHDGRAFNRHRIPYDRGKLADFYLQSLLPPGETDTLYMYGDSGNGLENERVTEWESIQIPAIIPPKRLHVSLAWSYAEFLYETWPNYLEAMQGFGFNCVACFPRYWKEEDVPKYQEIFDEAREMGMQIIVNESPAGALAADRDEPEVHSQLPDGPSGHACPSYRGQYYQVEHASFGQHAAWCRPDYIFYDIEAYWNGCVEAKRCSRCQQRFAEGGFDDYDEFCAALGREIHVSMNEVTEKAVADAGIEQSITYGSYRTEPETALNDGLFRFSDLYPDLLQLAMPSLYVAGNQMAVASNISANRAQMDTNDTIPWLSTGTYGEYDPVRTRDMILEALANGARGITYYSYGDFDPLHFKYHAEAVGIVTPIEDIFVDGTPLSDLEADNDQVKLCGIGLDGEIAVLLSNYRGLEPGTEVTISVSGEKGVPVWDLHSRRKIGKVRADGTFRTAIDDINARLFYVGSKHVEALAR